MPYKSIKLLSDFIAIQSVSSDISRHPEILKAVEFLKKEIESLGFEVKIYQKDGCPPLIIAKPAFAEASTRREKTIGVYAHYDVQPEDPVDQWNSPPFTLTAKNGKFFGRGVADDKGHIVQILAAIKQLVNKKKFNNNVVLIFEGEEEIGSQNFEYLINQSNKDLKDIDVFYVLDMGMRDKNKPQIFYALRGIIGYELTIRIGKSDLHSGVYGNRVLNPITVLADLLVKMKDPYTQKIKIPKFYDQVEKILDEEMNLLSKIPYEEEMELKDSGVFGFIKGPLASKLEPSIEINSISYDGKGFKTIIPATVTTKFTIRLVKNQDHKKISVIVEDFIKKNLPKQVAFEIKKFGGEDFFYTDFKNPYTLKTATILKEVFNHEAYFNRSGGSVGAAGIIQRIFRKPVILTGFTLPDENIHAPNENIDQKMFEKGITVLEQIFSQ